MQLEQRVARDDSNAVCERLIRASPVLRDSQNTGGLVGELVNLKAIPQEPVHALDDKETRTAKKSSPMVASQPSTINA
jgi:hypothetical protein